jgi:hypothetical protein
MSWNDWDFDNFKFVVHELFLYAVACFNSVERFDMSAHLLTEEYYVAPWAETGRTGMVGFEVFRDFLTSLDSRKQRLRLNRISLRADLLKDRCKAVAVKFQRLMEADFSLYLRSNASGGFWWPETLVFAGYVSGGNAFEIFARSKSRRYFDRVKVLVGVSDAEELHALVKRIEADPRRIPRFEHRGINLRALLGLDSIATKP